jgi:hypothetical protein
LWTTTSPVRVIRHKGLKATVAAPCTFLHEGREAVVRYKREGQRDDRES